MKVTTERLFLENISIEDAAFMMELVNTKEWLKFIGERHLHQITDAIDYIQQTMENPNADYSVVKRKKDGISIGVVTLLKRAGFKFYDIGFAFLPEYGKQGYAFEAVQSILEAVQNYPRYASPSAITIAENFNSIHLLEKLGFTYERPIVMGNQKMLLYKRED